MCEHINLLSKMQLFESIKYFDDQWKKIDEENNYLYFTCNICNIHKEQLYNYCYFIKCPICYKYICNDCQDIINHSIIFKYNNVTCCDDKQICHHNIVYCKVHNQNICELCK